jgi:hypothetical protein
VRVATLVVAGLLLAAAPSAGAFTFFQSPSGNIGCVIVKRQGVRCDIRERSWQPPPKPDWCTVDWAGGMEVGRRGRGQFICAGDTVLNDKRKLAYGTSIRRGRFVCTSRRSGMRCRNRRNGHGFRLSRERARGF